MTKERPPIGQAAHQSQATVRQLVTKGTKSVQDGIRAVLSAQARAKSPPKKQ